LGVSKRSAQRTLRFGGVLGRVRFADRPYSRGQRVAPPGLARDHRRVTGQGLSAAQIAAAAEQGSGPARASLRRYEDRLARGLAHVINILDPDVIVLGGGLSRLGRLYRNVPRLWGRYVFSDRVDTALEAPRFGDSSGVRGAARLW
jgi:predicted NBD/HSP70 family sugar kinase